VHEERLSILPVAHESKEVADVVVAGRNDSGRWLVDIVKLQAQVSAVVRRTQLRERRFRIQKADDSVWLSAADEFYDLRQGAHHYAHGHLFRVS
jgi:hypothetical protein